MNSMKVLSLSLLLSYAPLHSALEPIVFESAILKLFDGTTLFNANSVDKIHKYIEQVQRFMFTPYPAGTTTRTLIELARLETAQKLSPEETDVPLAIMLQDFAAFSDHFVDKITATKGVLYDLIKEFSIKRNRPDTTLLAWVDCTHGEERILFKREITSYNKLGNFAIDLIHFLKDLLHSCPKAVAEYTHRTNRLHDIRTHVNLLLKERGMSLEQKAYEALVIAISKKYQSYEDATPEKTKAYFGTSLTP
jgi:hypothetical protein